MWPLTLVAIALILLHLTLISWRLSMLFQPQGLALPLKTSFRLTLIGLFFDIFLPGASGGPVAILFYATRENSGRRTQVATVVVFDRIVGLFSLLALPLIFAPTFWPLVSRVHTLGVIVGTYAVIVTSLLGLLLLCLGRPSGVSHFADIVGYSSLRRFALRALETVRAYRGHSKTLWAALGLSLLANLSMVGVIAVGLRIVNPASVVWRLCLIVPIGQIANSLPITPGGLGVGEMAFNTLFKLSGLAGGAEAVLCWRVWAALVSGLGLFYYVRGMERRIVTAVARSHDPSWAEADPEATRAPSQVPAECTTRKQSPFQ